MTDASKMDAAKYGPTFYGNISMIEKLTLGMTLTRMLKDDIALAPPKFLLNLGLLLIVTAMQRMKTDTPDAIMADVSDCAVRSLSNMRAWVRDNEM
jgi:hypothetical protein